MIIVMRRGLPVREQSPDNAMFVSPYFIATAEPWRPPPTRHDMQSVGRRIRPIVRLDR